MKSTCFILLIAAARAFAAEHPHTDHLSSGPDKINLPPHGVTIPIDMKSGQPVVQVRFNGKGPFRMFLDTGSGGLVLNQDLADELHLKSLGEDRVGDPTNSKALVAHRVRIDSLALGDALFTGLHAVVIDRPFRGKNPPRGVVGLPAFGNSLVTIDFPAARLKIERGSLPEPDRREVLAYDLTDGNIPSIEIEAAGKTFRAHIDSGSMGEVTFNEKFEKQLPLKDKPVVVGRARTVNSDFEIRAATLDGTLRLGRYEFHSPQITFDPIAPFANIGSTFLADYALTFDLDHHRVRFSGTPGDHPRRIAAGPRFAGPPRGRPRTGIAFAMRDIDGESSMVIETVVPGSPAEKAGLKKGDRVQSINGNRVADLDSEGLCNLMSTGKSFTFVVDRDGKQKQIEIKLK